uniref:Integrase catalytic domain-containing protein n=1 Tax=Fagus sylvatica TaxID=28930 RepID=A0A2N9GBA7_FAGSY
MSSSPMGQEQLVNYFQTIQVSPAHLNPYLTGNHEFWYCSRSRLMHNSSKTTGSNQGSNVQGQNPPQPPPSDPNRELKEKDVGAKTLPQNEGGNQEKPHQDSGSRENEATFVTMSDVVNLLKQEREKNPKEPRLFVKKPPYPTELLKQPYPEKYIVPTFSRFDGRKGSALVADGVVKLPEVSKKVTEEDKKNPKFCYFHQYVHHSTADCWTLRRKFHKKIQDGTLEVPQAKQKVHTDPFLKHKDRVVVSIVIHGSASDVDMDEPVAANSTITPTAIKTLQRNPRFRSLFNQLGLNPEARTAATEAIMAIAADSRAHCFTAETHASRAFLETTNAITFTDEDMEHNPSSRNLSKEDPRSTYGDKRFQWCWCAGAKYPQQEAPKPEEGVLQPSCLTVSETDVPESADTAEATTADPKISAKEELKVINLSFNPNVHRPVSISALLSVEERMHLVELLKEYQDVFAWQYDEMPGIDPKLVAHSLNVEPGTRPVVQPMRTFHPEVEYSNYSRGEEATFSWFHQANTTPTVAVQHSPCEEKNSQIRYCVDFRNLNKACPKDEFSLSNMDLLIDSAAGHAMFSFMDGFSGYNQIFMSPRDAEKTAFRTPIGNFYYTVMPFGLKNAGATYQRTMTAMFHDMMHREIEDYVDDIVVKSKMRRDHFGILKKVFERCRLYKLKINPLKCAFGVSAGKFLGFLVHQRGIDVDPVRASAIATMKPPTTHKELKSFLGKLSYIRRFIPGHAAVTSTFAPLLKKGAPFHWSTECQEAFEKMKYPGKSMKYSLAGLADSVWTLKFDGSSTATSAGAGIVLYKGDGEAVTKSFKFDFPCSNNAAEYEAYLAGLAIAYEMGIKHLRVIGDSNLVKLEAKFYTFEMEHAQKNENRYTDALGTLGSQITFEGEEMDVTICKKIEPITESLKKEFEELSPNQEDWRVPIKAKLMSPVVAADLREIKDYTLISRDLYRRLPEGVLAWCISIEEAKEKLLEVHEKTCGDRGIVSLYRRLQRLGYFWPNMSAKAAEVQSQCPTYQFHYSNEEKDAADFVKTCHTCQVQANLIHTHPTSLQNIATPWPFHTWGLDLIGPINPASGDYIWILVATEYFTKWVEAIPLRKATGAAVANFIREHIITRFGISYKLISDNGTPFISKDVREVLEHYRVKHRHSTPYYPQGFTPFSLVYGTDTISPIELVVPSSRVMQGSELEVDANMCAEARMADLEGLDEARDLTKAKSQRNYQKMANVYSKALRIRVFVKGQMVLKAAEFVKGETSHSPSKFSPNWDGPYIIRRSTWKWLLQAV